MGQLACFPDVVDPSFKEFADCMCNLTKGINKCETKGVISIQNSICFPLLEQPIY